MRAITNKALLSFMIYSEAGILAFASAVIKAITGNTNFPNAAPLLANVVTAYDAYAASLALAGFAVDAVERDHRSRSATWRSRSRRVTWPRRRPG